jgi:hypothetical protein
VTAVSRALTNSGTNPGAGFGGDEIIETPPMVRSRYFECELYKEIFTEYFLHGARWTVAPKSRLLNRNFDYDYVKKRGYDGPVPTDPFFEIMFDAAQILRLGRDLIFNASTRNHRMVAEASRRRLSGSHCRDHGQSHRRQDAPAEARHAINTTGRQYRLTSGFAEEVGYDQIRYPGK